MVWCTTVDLSNFGELKTLLVELEFYYNWHRPHGSLNGKSPIDLVMKFMMYMIIPKSTFSFKITMLKWLFES